MYRQWTAGLFRRDRDVVSHTSHTPATYLSDVISNDLSEMIIISRDKFVYGRSVMEYTAFNGYPELYRFMKSVEIKDRQLHEVVPEHSKQKPRFDIDIKKTEYLKYILEPGREQISFVNFGEIVKDMVIKAAIKVMATYGVTIGVSTDFMVFTSHGENKRSYHIILNGYYHYGNEQAKTFYELCVREMNIDNAVGASSFVDASIYGRNRSLRLLWCVKINPETREARSKIYPATFNYQGKVYEQRDRLLPYFDDEEEEIIGTTLKHMCILSHSLVTFTAEAVPMPIFPVTRKMYEYNEEIPDNVFEECKSAFADWDTEGNFTVDGSGDGIIHLHRLKPSYCDICNNYNTHPHKSNMAFCFINDNQLYWNCGRAKANGRSGTSINIATLSTIRSAVDLRIDRLIAEGIIKGSPSNGNCPNLSRSCEMANGEAIAIEMEVVDDDIILSCDDEDTILEECNMSSEGKYRIHPKQQVVKMLPTILVSVPVVEKVIEMETNIQGSNSSEDMDTDDISSVTEHGKTCPNNTRKSKKIITDVPKVQSTKQPKPVPKLVGTTSGISKLRLGIANTETNCIIQADKNVDRPSGNNKMLQYLNKSTITLPTEGNSTNLGTVTNKSIDIRRLAEILANTTAKQHEVPTINGIKGNITEHTYIYKPTPSNGIYKPSVMLPKMQQSRDINIVFVAKTAPKVQQTVKC
jgi:hypothetical protein